MIKCEYSLKETSYFDYSVLGKDRLRVEMPIYDTHQLQKDYELERDTNQEFTPRDFQKEFGAYGNNNNNWGNNNNNSLVNNNNNSWGNNNINLGSNNNNMGTNNNKYGGNNNNNSFGDSNNNYGKCNNSNNKGSEITYSTNGSQKSLMKHTLPQKKWIIFLYQLKWIIMILVKVSQLN